MDKAGQSTARRGLNKVVRALLMPRVLLVVAGVPIAIALVDVLLNIGVRHWLGQSLGGTWFGFILGVGVTASFLVLLALVFVLAGGVNWLTGSLGERETARVLSRLGPRWKFAHNLSFTVGKPPKDWQVDVDHVAVGPYGVLVVESKYSTSPLPPDEIQPWNRDVRQARKNSALIQGLLDGASVDAPVRAVLVYWGWQPVLPDEPVMKVGDVRVVWGADADRWIPLLEHRWVEPAAEDAAWAVISKHAHEGDGS